MLKSAVSLYVLTVLDPLRLNNCRKTVQWHHEPPLPEHRTTGHQLVGPESDSQSSSSTESYGELSFICRGELALSASDIKIQMNSKMSYFEERVHAQFTSSCIADGQTIIEQLRKSPDAVPTIMHKPAYCVVQSSRVTPLATSTTGLSHCPVTLLPINFILVQYLEAS